MLLPALAHRAVDAVGADDQVGLARHHVDRPGFGLVIDIDAQFGGALLQDRQQRQAAQAGKTVPAGAHHMPLVVDMDVVPVGEVRGNRAVRGLVGEHDAEAEGVVGPIALGDADARIRE
jgi:hypothetical protein